MPFGLLLNNIISTHPRENQHINMFNHGINIELKLLDKHWENSSECRMRFAIPLHQFMTGNFPPFHCSAPQAPKPPTWCCHRRGWPSGWGTLLVHSWWNSSSHLSGLWSQAHSWLFVAHTSHSCSCTHSHQHF